MPLFGLGKEQETEVCQQPLNRALALGQRRSFQLANIVRGANSFGPSGPVALSRISMFYEQTMLSERLMMASNRRAAKLDNSYGAFLLPAAISCLLAQTRSEGFPGSKNVPAQSGSYLRPPFDTIRELLSIGILHFDWQKPYSSVASDSRSGNTRCYFKMQGSLQLFRVTILQ